MKSKIILALILSVALNGYAAMPPLALRCEYRVNPAGIDEAQPRLSWQLESSERGQKQTAYQILVASNPELPQAHTFQKHCWRDDSGLPA